MRSSRRRTRVDMSLKTLKQKAKHLKTDIPAVFIAMKHPQTPLLAKILAGIAVVYVLSPIDLIPDFIPVLGYLDDVLLIPGLIAVAIKLIPDEVFEECQLQAEDLWVDGKPKKWYYALPIVILWILAIAFIARLFLK